jgi:hypothetical protein
MPKCGDNVMGADNQQERLDAQWVSGFVDGEGCFHVAINRISKMTLGWQVLPEFRIVQHQRDEKILHLIKDFLGCGKVVVNHGDRKELRVRGINDLKKVVKFFKKHRLQTTKRKNFDLFAEIISMMEQKRHLSHYGLRGIAEKASKMNQQIKKRYLESSETARQTLHLK